MATAAQTLRCDSQFTRVGGVLGPRDNGVCDVCFFPGRRGEHQCWCWLCGFRDAFSRFDVRALFSSEIFSAGKSCVPWGSCRIPCRDGCRVADSLRLVEAMPLSERLGHTLVEVMPFFKRFGHTVLAMLGNLAATFCKVSEMVLLAWGMQNSEQGKGEVPRVICLNEMVPDGSSRPGHGLPP